MFGLIGLELIGSKWILQLYGTPEGDGLKLVKDTKTLAVGVDIRPSPPLLLFVIRRDMDEWTSGQHWIELAICT